MMNLVFKQEVAGRMGLSVSGLLLQDVCALSSLPACLLFFSSWLVFCCVVGFVDIVVVGCSCVQ